MSKEEGKRKRDLIRLWELFHLIRIPNTALGAAHSTRGKAIEWERNFYSYHRRRGRGRGRF